MIEAPKQSYISPKVELRESHIGGTGMFCKDTIEVEELVVQFGGTYVGKEEAEKVKRDGKIVMQWDDNLYSVEERGEDISYFINHSCDPNLWMNGSFDLVSRRKINKDEEVTIDYALFEAEENFVSEWECNCGSEDCRGRITGRDWERTDLQKRYKGHFSPLINKRIENLDK